MIRRWASLLVFALAACSGGSTAVGPPSAPSSATTFAVTVPASSTLSRVTIASSLESGAPVHTIDVTSGSTSCSAAGAQRTCSATWRAPLGPQVLTVATVGATTTTSTVRATLDGSRVALAVGATIAQISLDLAATQLAGGQSGTTTLYVTARDANGNTIVGDFGGASITVGSSDSTGAVTLSSTTVTAGGTPLTVTYNGSTAVGSVTFFASSSGVPKTAITLATLSFTNSKLMYISSANELSVFPMGASGNVAPLQTMVFPGAAFLEGGQPDNHGKVWVLINLAGGGYQLGFAPASASGIVTPTLVPSSAYPSGTSPTISFAVDANGTAYVLTYSTSSHTYAVYEFASGQTSASGSFTSSALPTNGAVCVGLDVGPDGSVVVKCTDNARTVTSLFVFSAQASGAVAPARTISGAATMLHPTTSGQWALFGADGSLYVLDVDAASNAAVVVFAPGASGNVAPARRIAGAGTGLDAVSLLVGGRQAHSLGFGVDPNGSVYVGQNGSQSGITINQVLQFSPNANGAAAPASVLGGPLTGFLSVPYNPIRFGPGTVTPAPAASPSVTGDFLAPAANRGWNYTFVPRPFGTSTPVPFTLSLYTDPTPVNGDTQLVVVEAPGQVPTAIGASGGVTTGAATFRQNPLGGWFATGYVPYVGTQSLGGLVPIPSNLTIVPGTLVAGQSFAPYLGVTGTVVSVGAVPGASNCPGGAATGAIVAYVIGRQVTETVGFVPGCGMTYFVSDNGSTAMLTSVGTYNAGQLARERAPLSVAEQHALSAVWTSVFTPWSP